MITSGLNQLQKKMSSYLLLLYTVFTLQSLRRDLGIFTCRHISTFTFVLTDVRKKEGD